MGYTGSVVTLRRFLAQLDDQAHRLQKVTVRFETPPGHQAQADWTEAGRITLADGKSANLYAFTMVLSFSRMLFVRFTTSMALPVLLDCHRSAFDYFGGWPHVILYDNMKQVRTAPGKLNESFLDFARHYGFEPKTCRPYRARTKGKVERIIDYVKDNFLLGLDYAGLDELNALARHWLDTTANVRLHATTRRRPIDLWPQEGLTLISSVPPYDAVLPARRTVSVEAMVHFQGSRYSVPPEHSGTAVLVTAAGGQVVIRQGDGVIAEHRQAAQPGQSIVARDHLAELWKITHQQTAAPPPGRTLDQATPEVLRVDLRAFEEVLP